MNNVKWSYNVIGIMSGTSFDGIDMALCRFKFQNGSWSFSITKAITVEYPNEWMEKLKYLENNKKASKKTSYEYGKFIGHLINQNFRKELKSVDFIASHGHTIDHDPAKGISFQAGDGNALFKETKIPVISNFRQQDVELGGEGAPLVPIGDLMLFPEYNVCLNIGGFANLSVKKSTTILAWDICPVNYVLNKLAIKLGHDFDKDGIIASNNQVNPILFDQLNQLEYYQQSPPKSLAREWVEKYISPMLQASDCTINDKISTFTEHAAFQIASALPKNTSVLITGGGGYNKHLLNRLNFYNQRVKIQLPESKIIEFKEALIFAFLGVLRIRNEVNVLSSVTGALKDHCAGNLTNN